MNFKKYFKIKESFSNKRNSNNENPNPYDRGSIFSNFTNVLCSSLPPSVINLRETIPNRLINGDNSSLASRYKLAADSQIVYKNSSNKNPNGELNEHNSISVNKQNISNDSNQLKTDAV